MRRKKPGPKRATRRNATKPEEPDQMNPWVSSHTDFSPERVETLRRWIAAGAYNSPEVAEAVARRILSRGDLREDARDELSLPRGSPFGRGSDDPLVH
jgi:hypothetical protein